MREMRIALAIAIAGALLVTAWSPAATAKRKRERIPPRGTVVSRSFLTSEVAVQSDGRLVTVGRTPGAPGRGKAGTVVSRRRKHVRPVVTRRLDNGQLDASFRSGVVPLPPKAAMYLIAIQPDGRIVIAGSIPGTGMSATGFPYDFVLARLLQNGDLDPSFGTGGVVRTDFGADDLPSVLTIQDDGKILLAGGADRGYPDRANPDSSFAVARYQPDGSLDPSFGTDGKVLISFGQFNSAGAIRVASDGRIALAGVNLADPGGNDPEKLAQARLLPDGSLDPSFGSGGKLVAPFLGPGEDVFLDSAPFVISGLTYTTGGRLIAVGEASKRRHRKILDLTKVARYTPDGAPDPSFGVGGQTMLRLRMIGRVTGAETADDGSIIVTGTTDAASDALQLARVTSEGAVDTTFGNRGSVKTRLPGLVSAVLGSALDQFGRVLVATYNGTSRFVTRGSFITRNFTVIARYQPSGKLDPSFGPRHKRHHRKHRRDHR